MYENLITKTKSKILIKLICSLKKKESLKYMGLANFFTNFVFVKCFACNFGHEKKSIKIKVY